MLSRKTRGASKNENRYFRGVRTCSWNSLTFFHPIYSSLLACLKPPIRECRFIFRRIGRFDVFLRWSFSNMGYQNYSQGEWQVARRMLLGSQVVASLLIFGVSGVTMAGSRMICPPKLDGYAHCNLQRDVEKYQVLPNRD